MNKTWLILDTNYLCHRAKYTVGDLSYQGAATGIIYGVLRATIDLMKLFKTKHVLFCWDYGRGIRCDVYPAYKANRKNRDDDLSDEEQKAERKFQKQVKLLRREYLKTIGFRNNFKQKGYEGDDIIASICHNISKNDRAVIVSADKDLYQLLTPRISMYNPQTRRMTMYRAFIKKYGIRPKKWATVKALAGCTTDNVKGIKGAGELTIIKYLKGELKTTHKIYKKIVEEEADCYQQNMPLVGLPLEGTKVFKLRKDKLTQFGWDCVIKKLGMKSLDKIKITRIV